MLKRTGLYVVTLILLIGCGSDESLNLDHDDYWEGDHKRELQSGHMEFAAFPMYNAKNFRLTPKNGFVELELLDPFGDGAPWEVYHTYILAPQEILDKIISHPGTSLVKTPVEKIAISGSPYIGYVDRVGAAHKIVGVDRKDLVFSEEVRRNFDNMAEFGEADRVNLEVMADIDPDIFITSGFPQSPEKLKKISDMGIPVLYALEWKEEDPLGRLEWLKLFAALNGTYEDGVKLYADAKQHYISVKEEADSVSHKKIMCGQMWEGVWYTPAGGSYMTNLMLDAGLDYPWYTDSASGSLPLSVEVILDKQSNAEIWINPGDVASMKEMLDKDKRYGLFEPFKRNEVFNYDAKKIENANAFWEQAAVYPGVLLNDLILLNKTHVNDSLLYFYRRLPQQ